MSAVHAVVSDVVKHSLPGVEAERHAPLAHVSPGQQSVSDAQVSLAVRQRQYVPVAVPLVPQVIRPQHTVVTFAPPSRTPPSGAPAAHAVPAPAQHCRVAVSSGAQRWLLQQSPLVVQLVLPGG
jgi:hypothetical protein